MVQRLNYRAAILPQKPPRPASGPHPRGPAKITVPARLPTEGIHVRHDGLRVLVVHVPFPPRSLSNNQRPAHWSAYNKDRVLYQAVVRQRINERCRFAPPSFVAAQIDLLALYPTGQNLTDEDGLCSMAKGTIDAVVSAGVIPNDNPEHMHLGPVRIRIARGGIAERTLFLIVRERRAVFGLTYRLEEIEDWS